MRPIDDFYSTMKEPEKGPANAPRKLSIGLIAVIMVAVFLGGFLTCFLMLTFVDAPSGESGDIGTQESILRMVLETIREDYIDDDITEEEWQSIIANGGTGLLHTLDDYGYLLSPLQYYEMFIHPTAEGSVDGNLFGFSYSVVSRVGLEVQSIVTDSAVYGYMEVGDVIVKAYTEYTNASINTPLTYGNKTINLKTDDTETIAAALSAHSTLYFEYIRQTSTGEETYCHRFTKRGVYNNNANGFNFVEYYFSTNNTNVSTTNYINTKSLRSLALLDNTDVGYIAIKEFSGAVTGEDETIVYASDEFKQAMELFKQAGKKYLILDLKGNPGGDVTEAQTIASALIYDSTAVSNELLVTKLHFRNEVENSYYTIRDDADYGNYGYYFEYENYFDVSSDDVQIVVFTDGNSASASELLLGAMLDYGTAVQFGTTTYGKGIAQSCIAITRYPQTITYNNQSVTSYYALYFTSASYTTPNGTNIHGEGYTPTNRYNNLTSYYELMSSAIAFFG